MRVTELHQRKKITKPLADIQEMIKKGRKEDAKLVKGQFEFVDAEGGFFEFTYRKWPGDPIQTFELIHGEICEIPLGVVKHLNNTKRKISRYMDVEQSPKGPIKAPKTYDKISRIRFVPQDYL